MYHLAEHIEADKITYSERFKEPFQCKLCTFKSSNDHDIRDHMIKHVENGLVPEETTEIIATNEETEEREEFENELDDNDDSEDENLCEGFDEDGNWI